MAFFSFVHAADLHLDSPFIGLSQLGGAETKLAETLREATFRAFETLINLCLDRKVDFLLIAGDVYDAADRSLRAQLRFRDGLGSLAMAGIQSFVVHGNHDPLDGQIASIRMPEAVHVFGPKPESVLFVKNGEAMARIHGVSYPKRDPGKTFGRGIHREGSEPFQIGLFHCNAGGDPLHEPYAPRTLEELVESGLDYWALGHIHERRILSSSRPFVGYPGNTQGRHINEPGQRGCFFVRVSSNGEMEGEPEFVPTDAVRWSTADMDVGGLQSEGELLAGLEATVEGLSARNEGRPALARIALKGRGPLHHLLLRPHKLQELTDHVREFGKSLVPFAWVEQLDDNTHAEVDLAARRQAQDFLGDLLRLIEEVRRSSERLPELQAALDDLYGHARAGRLLPQPDSASLLRLLDDAESLCVDLLAGEEE